MNFNVEQNRLDLIESSIGLIESTYELTHFHGERYDDLINSSGYSNLKKDELWLDFRTLRIRIIRGDCHEEIALAILKKYPNSLLLTSDSLVTTIKDQNKSHSHQITAQNFFESPEPEEEEFKTALALQGGLEIMLIDRGCLSYNDLKLIRQMNASLTVFLGSISFKEEQGDHTQLFRLL